MLSWVYVSRLETKTLRNHRGEKQILFAQTPIGEHPSRKLLESDYLVLPLRLLAEVGLSALCPWPRLAPLLLPCLEV